MRLRLRTSVIALATVVATSFGMTATATAAPAPQKPVAGSGDFGSVDFGSSAGDLLSPNSVFLWSSPPTRYIVVLGAKMGTLGQAPEILKSRMNVGAKLAKTHPFNRVIVSGGDTWWLPVSEAQFMNLGLISRGVPIWQMLNEGKSTSTVQNAANTVRMLKGLGATGAVIVTNGFHMSRAMKNFRDAARQQGARLEFRAAYA